MSTLSQRYRPRPDVRYRVVEGEAVVVMQRSAELLLLNEVGAAILRLLDGHRTAAQVLDELRREFDVEPAELERDLRAFIDELAAAGVIETAPD